MLLQIGKCLSLCSDFLITNTQHFNNMSILLFYGSSSSTSKALMICINFIQDVAEEHKKEHEEEATGRAHSALLRKILRIHTTLPSLSSLSAFLLQGSTFPGLIPHSQVLYLLITFLAKLTLTQLLSLNMQLSLTE